MDYSTTKIDCSFRPISEILSEIAKVCHDFKVAGHFGQEKMD